MRFAFPLSGPTDGSAEPPSASPAHVVVLVLGETEDQATSGVALAMTHAGFVVERACTGYAVERLAATGRPDVLVLRATLPDTDGITLCQQLKSRPHTRLLPVVLLLDEYDPVQQTLATKSGADACYASSADPVELAERLNVLARMKRYTDGFEPIAAVMTTVATLLEADRGYSEGHCIRMANYARGVGRRLGLTLEDLETLERGSFLHDIGMLTVPGVLVQKPGALEQDELAIVQSHATAGESLIAQYRTMQLVRPLVLHHHERYDGSGYPHGLKGDEIPLLAQIVGLVDTLEAATSPRSYRRPESLESTLDLLRRGARLGKWRTDLVEHLSAVVYPWTDQ